jgi:hypothetical protein
MFDKKAAEADNYEKVETGLEPKNGMLVFKEGYVKKAFFHKRPLTPKTCEVFIDPLFAGVKEALAVALEKRQGLTISIKPLLTETPDLDSVSGEDRLRREEAQRWLLLSRRYPASYAKYLEAFLKRKDASYWFLTLKDLKVNVDAFVKDIGAQSNSLRDLWKTQTELGMSGPVEVVINNREVVRIKSRNELNDILGKVAGER